MGNDKKHMRGRGEKENERQQSCVFFLCLRAHVSVPRFTDSHTFIRVVAKWKRQGILSRVHAMLQLSKHIMHWELHFRHTNRHQNKQAAQLARTCSTALSSTCELLSECLLPKLLPLLYLTSKLFSFWHVFPQLQTGETHFVCLAEARRAAQKCTNAYVLLIAATNVCWLLFFFVFLGGGRLVSLSKSADLLQNWKWSCWNIWWWLRPRIRYTSHVIHYPEVGLSRANWTLYIFRQSHAYTWDPAAMTHRARWKCFQCLCPSSKGLMGTSTGDVTQEAPWANPLHSHLCPQTPIAP